LYSLPPNPVVYVNNPAISNPLVVIQLSQAPLETSQIPVWAPQMKYPKTDPAHVIVTIRHDMTTIPMNPTMIRRWSSQVFWR
jgi:hypothetical protein